MSTKKSIDKALYRTLKNGEQYNSFFNKSTCEPTYLGEGDTFLTMDEIKSSIVKHVDQTKKVAKVLKRSSLQRTINEVYSFLYNHIQYNADGRDQNLKSPQCSWFSRNEGIDCKSYSIFAGCILSNLGIKYYIRKIKQPYMLPSQFTHVYIVVPKNQDSAKLSEGYYVIDATKHSNTEAAFIDKKDIFMDKLPHYGLNAPSVSEGGSFVGIQEPIPSSILGEFDKFQDFLRSVGISESILSPQRAHLLTFIEKGINPQFGILKEGVIIGRTNFPYFTPSKNSVSPKKYRSPISLARQISTSVPMYGGLNADENGEVNEEDLGDEIATVAGELVTNSSWWNNTIAAVLGNGWNLSCWGSSNNPEKSKEQVRIDAPAYFKASNLEKAINTENVNKFVQLVYPYIKHREFGKTNNNIANCTRKGNEAGYVAMKAYYDKMIAEIGKILADHNGSLVAQGITQLNSYNIPVPSGYHDGTIAPHPPEISTITIPVYVVNAPVPVSFPPVTGNDPNGNGSPSTPDPSPNTGGNATGGTNTGSNTGDPFANITASAPATLINAYIDHLIKNEGLFPVFRTPATRVYYRTGPGATSGNPNLKLPVVQKALAITSLIDKNVYTNVSTSNTATQQAGINPILALSLIAGGVYLYQKNKKKTTKKVSA